MNGGLRSLFAVLCLLACAHASPSADSSRQEVMRMAGDAARLIATAGEDSALAAISDTSGPFVRGELYVFVYDFEGTVVAHSQNPKLVGKSMLDIPDAEGKLFRREILRIAATVGVGWVDYKYRNPVNNRIEPKSTWIRKVGRFVVCCGVYL